MKSSSDYINESVYKVNRNYANLQNKTEELFFECLDEERDVNYFIYKLDEIWGNIDHTFIDEQINEYINIIHENTLRQLNIQEEEKNTKINPKMALGLVALGGLLLKNKNKMEEAEQKFENIVVNRYKTYSNSPQYKEDKQEYLKLKVSQYDNQVVPYFNKDGEVTRYVQLSTYEAMIQNTNLTRAAWNSTINDGLNLGYTRFWIPPHLFSCDKCSEWQGKILNSKEVMDFASHVEEQEGDILHPNCKCSLLIYTNDTELRKQELSKTEIDEYYKIRQQVNSLTLKKDRLLTDLRIQRRLGNQDEVDKLNSQRNKVNTQIRELINELPTEEMKKKVVAINR